MQYSFALFLEDNPSIKPTNQFRQGEPVHALDIHNFPPPTNGWNGPGQYLFSKHWHLMKLGRNKSAGLHVEMQIKWEEMFPAIYRLSWPRFQLFLLPFFFFFIYFFFSISLINIKTDGRGQTKRHIFNQANRPQCQNNWQLRVRAGPNSPHCQLGVNFRI